MVFEQSLAKNFRLVVSGYYYPVRGVISAVTNPASGQIVYQNSQRVDLRGTEITLKRQSRSGLEAGMSVSLEDARNLTPRVPHQLAPRVGSG